MTLKRTRNDIVNQAYVLTPAEIKHGGFQSGVSLCLQPRQRGRIRRTAVLGRRNLQRELQARKSGIVQRQQLFGAVLDGRLGVMRS